MIWSLYVDQCTITKFEKQNNLTYVSSKERKKEQNIKQNLGYLEMLLQTHGKDKVM